MVESLESSPGTERAEAETETEESPGTGTHDPLEELARFFVEEPPSSESDSDDENDDGKAPGGSPSEAKPKKFNDLAERLGVELSDLYKLEIAAAEDGSPITIEQLKDHYAKRSEFSVRELEWEEERSKREKELLRATQEMQTLMESLPKAALKPEIVQAIKDKVDRQLSAARVKALEVIPEWKDAERRKEEIKGISEHLTEYGFPLDYLAQISDHRTLKYIRDSWLREQRITRALANVRKQPPAKSTKSKPAPLGKATTQAKPRRKSRESALAELLING